MMTMTNFNGADPPGPLASICPAEGGSQPGVPSIASLVSTPPAPPTKPAGNRVCLSKQTKGEYKKVRKIE